MNHVMLDIETLGQGPDSVITSIAAVQFDIKTGEIGNTFRQDVNLDSNTKLGRKIDNSTLLWWFEQSPEAIKGLTNSFKKGADLSEVLKDLSIFFYTLNQRDEIFVWGRGPRFDQAILTHAYVSLERDIPWKFRNEMCVRTMEWLRPEIKVKTPKADKTGHGSNGGGLHDAFLDAKYQIAYVSNIYHDICMRVVTNTLTQFDKDQIVKAAENVAVDIEVLKQVKEAFENFSNDSELGERVRTILFNNYVKF